MNPKSLLTDSGFWIALLDKENNTAQNQVAISNLEIAVENNYSILVPWPTLYEFVNTRLARRKHHLFEFEHYFQRLNLELLDENKYRARVLQKTFGQARFGYLNHSLVDCVIREILGDLNIRVDFLATFNPDDFADMCAQRRIELLN